MIMHKDSNGGHLHRRPHKTTELSNIGGWVLARKLPLAGGNNMVTCITHPPVLVTATSNDKSVGGRGGVSVSVKRYIGTGSVVTSTS